MCTSVGSYTQAHSLGRQELKAEVGVRAPKLVAPRVHEQGKRAAVVLLHNRTKQQAGDKLSALDHACTLLNPPQLAAANSTDSHRLVEVIGVALTLAPQKAVHGHGTNGVRHNWGAKTEHKHHTAVTDHTPTPTT
jgi:hypothetical protein